MNEQVTQPVSPDVAKQEIPDFLKRPEVAVQDEAAQGDAGVPVKV